MRTRGFALAAMTIAALSACGSSNGGEGGAYRACERAVETTLKAPSTADFSGALNSDIAQDGDTYKVRGYVDAENSFGGTVRNDFACTLRDTGDNWELVDLNVS